jgi:MATE family multidrug resistance protein
MSNRELHKEVLQLAWPAVLQGLLSTIILFTDRLILGQYSDAALGSMQVSGPLLWSVFSLFGAYGSGVLAIIGRAIGAGDKERVAKTFGTAIIIALSLGTIVGMIGYLGAPTITEWMLGERSSNSHIAPMSITYLETVMLSGPLLLLGSVTNVAFQASGDTKTPMWLTLCSGLINLGVSWVLVFGIWIAPELGILGAAIGTVCATAGNALIGMGILLFKKNLLRIGRANKTQFHAIMNIAWPAFGEKILFHTGFLIFASYIGRLGDIEIESLGFIGANAFGVAAGTLAAQQLGKKNPQNAEEAVLFSAKIGTATLCTIGVFFVLFAPQLVGLFSSDPEVIALGVTCLFVAGLAQPLMALADVFGGALRGAGDTKTPMKAAIVGPLLVRPILCYLLCFEFEMGLVGIWIGSTFDWLIRSIWLYRAFRKGDWKKISV